MNTKIPHYDEHMNIIDTKNIEDVEQNDAFNYIYKDDIVLELGGRYGTVSTIINNKLDNKKNHVVIEPDSSVIESLKINRKNHKCHFEIFNGIISNKKNIKLNNHGYGSFITEIHNNETSNIQIISYENFLKIYNLNFNTLVVDCEGCFLEFIIIIGDNISKYNKIFLEKDYPDKCNYNEIEKILYKYNFVKYRDGFHSIYVKYTNNLYILSHNAGGGLSQYVQNMIDIQKKNDLIIYTNEKFIVKDKNIKILNNIDIIKKIINIDYRINVKNIININIFPFTLKDIDSILDILKYKKFTKIILNIHDFYLLYHNDPNKINIKEKSNTVNICQKIFDISHMIIIPSTYIKNVFEYHSIKTKKYLIEDHPDINLNDVKEYYPFIKNNTVKILFIGNTSKNKGFELLIEIIQNIKNYKKYNINLYIVGNCSKKYYSKNINIYYYNKYENTDIFKIINQIEPTILLAMSIFPETWSYVLSILLKTGLPIFYNNIKNSSYGERIIKNKRNNCYSFNSEKDKINQISDKLLKFIDIIYSKQNSNYKYINDKYKINTTEFYNNLYKNLFKEDFNKIDKNDEIIHNIKLDKYNSKVSKEKVSTYIIIFIIILFLLLFLIFLIYKYK
jgi:FkbM family methyltransferase